MSATVGDLVAARSLAVVAGTGGVGKTTVSAALAIGAARRIAGDVLVLTIDPARRLASALGIEIVGNEPSEVDLGDLASDGRLYAAMLDPSEAWDAMVRNEAPEPELADQILANSVYRRIADTFVHGNDYAALGWLDAALESNSYDLVIVDTPPSQNALGLFDAPERVAEFFDSSLLGWLTKGESGRIVGGPAAKTFGVVADRLLGSQFFGDIVEFFQLMQTVVPGMVERTRSVAAELAGDDAVFVAVTSPSPDALANASGLGDQLAERGLDLDAVVINGVEPDVYWNPKTADVSRRVLNRDRSPFSASATELLGPGADYVSQQCEVASSQRNAVTGKFGKTPNASIPRVVHSPTTITELATIGEMLWATTER